MRVVSFGSLNADLAIAVPHLAAPDETVAAHGLVEHLGGKGANQAVAAARLGADVSMIGAVGDDAHGARLRAGLAAAGVDVDAVRVQPGPSGIAVIQVADDGGVNIVVVAGANAAVDAADAERASTLIRGADVLLLQGEVAAAASLRAADIARRAGTFVVFNPAPVAAGAAEVAASADLVIANRVEADQLGLVASSRVVVTLGAEGALAGSELVAAYPATVVDATGAGDAFVASCALSRAGGAPLVEAVRRGCAAGAWAVGVAGAQPSLPDTAEVDEVMRRDTG
ncbi:MAG: PfkB family carbohydrate kinase [Acidimicrobiia bacterium]|nr:PfkB family carbohydrate kinase [Acidimicrobiia bacterium]